MEAAAMSSERSARLTEREIALLTAVAEAAMPTGRVLEGAGRPAALAVGHWLGGVNPETTGVVRAAMWALEVSTLPTHFRAFSALPLEKRMVVMRQWEESRAPTVRNLLRAVVTPLKQHHFDRPEMFRHVGCRYGLPTVKDEAARYMARVTNGREITQNTNLECEVVVVGTGAGGAAVAYELASRGRAVLLLEEGDYHRRSSFDGKTSTAYRNLYRDQGTTIALGNANLPVFAGRAVGGSTVVNSGTCYRAPERTFKYWRDRYGLPQVFSSTGLAPYYERVESMLGVAPGNPLHLGAIAGIIARGAEHLKLSHKALLRNAPDCDGQGVCCFGCPTGAKRSTDVSYIPAALGKGAELITGARVDFVDIVAGRARGVTATVGDPAQGAHRPRIRVKAEAVVVAGGTLMTPLLLEQSKACLSSGMLGKNLSVHPATKVMALFDEPVESWKGIPQSYTIDHYAEEGLMFEGGSLPFDVAALGVLWTGHRFMELMEKFPYLATFGFMIQEKSRGSVRRGPGGRPLMFYNLNREDTQQMQRGVEILCAVYQAAGAKRVFPFVAGHDEVTTQEQLENLKKSRIGPGDMDMAAFHPLGTCRLGTDPARSCIGPDHEAHDVENLFVCDGSAVPSSLGVNPQMTIMALALRAAEIIDSRLG